MAWSSRHWATRNTSTTVRDLLALIVKGQALPDEEDNAIARNTQLHLYIGAILRSAGVDVKLDEPDVLAKLDRRWIGIAAKRITSLKRFTRRVSDGRRQLESAKTRGIVWIDITDALHEFSGIFLFDDVADLTDHHAAVEDHAYQAVAELRKAIRPTTHLADVLMSWVEPRTVRGLGTLMTDEFLLPFGLHDPGTIERRTSQLLLDRVEQGIRRLGQAPVVSTNPIILGTGGSRLPVTLSTRE